MARFNREDSRTVLPQLEKEIGKAFDELKKKQDKLISGLTIKTVNHNSLLGEGNITISGGGGSSDYGDLTSKPQINGNELIGNKTSANLGLANATHTHTKSQISDFSHTHTKSQISDFSHTHTKSDVTDFSHTHTKSDVTDFPTLSSVATSGSYNDLSNKPSLFSGDYNDLANKPTIPTVPTNVSSFVNDVPYLTSHQSLSAYRTSADQDTIDATKQDTLVSGTNIKTVNNTSLLGSGNITIGGGGGGQLWSYIECITSASTGTSYNYFSPTYNNNVTAEVMYNNGFEIQKGSLYIYDRNINGYYFVVPSGVNYIELYASMHLKQGTTSARRYILQAIKSTDVTQGGGETSNIADALNHGTESRFSFNGTKVLPVQEGDCIYLRGYKSSSSQVVSVVYCYMYIKAIG